MRALIQRVSQAQVAVEQTIVGKINNGLLILLGVGNGDVEADARYLLDKIVNLRIFADDNGKLNLSLKELQLPLLVVSQFTLFADCRKGRRPFMGEAAEPEQAERLVERFCEMALADGIEVERGQFGAHMEVSLCNDGPVTIWLDTQEMKADVSK